MLFVPLQVALIAVATVASPKSPYRQWRARRIAPLAIARRLLLALTAGTLLLTQSRGAWAEMIVATVACVAWRSRTTRRRRRLASRHPSARETPRIIGSEHMLDEQHATRVVEDRGDGTDIVCRREGADGGFQHPPQRRTPPRPVREPLRVNE